MLSANIQVKNQILEAKYKQNKINRLIKDNKENLI